MITRRVAVAVALGLGLAFAGVSLTKNFSSSDAPRDTVAATLSQERRRIQLFWETYREATDHRVSGRIRQAAEAYERALSVNDSHEDALYYLGNALFALARFSDAQATWQRLLEVNPHSSRAHSRLGDLYFCFDPGAPFDLSAARAAFRRALEINQEETGPLLRLGQVALLAGDTARARRHFDAVIGSNYRSVASHFLKGYMAWKAGARREASDLFAMAVRLKAPENPTAGVPGEGDTEKGSVAMVTANPTCHGLEAHIDNVSLVTEGDLARQTTEHYGRLDTFLADARSRLLGDGIARAVPR